MLVFQKHQHEQPDDAQQAQQAQPSGISLALGVLHTAPDEEHSTGYQQQRSQQSATRIRRTRHRPTRNLGDDAQADANVCVGFALLKHSMISITGALSRWHDGRRQIPVESLHPGALAVPYNFGSAAIADS